MKKFDHPISIYLIITLMSTVIAVLLFQLGGSMAEVVNQKDNAFGFKAGGAIAGFIIIFWLSYRVIRDLFKERNKQNSFKIYMRDKNLPFNRNSQYKVTCIFYDDSTGTTKSQQFDTFIDNGYLGFQLPDIDEGVAVSSLTASDGQSTWNFGYFNPRNPKIEL